MRRHRFTFLLLVMMAPCADAQQPQTPAPAPRTLTLQDAERIAVANHPLLRAAQFAVQAVQQTIREARSTYYPYSFGSVTAVEADHNSRIAAGGLNNPVIYNRESNGVQVAEMIFRFRADAQPRPDLHLQHQIGRTECERPP